MKILYVTTIGSTTGFFKKYIGELLALGHQVDIAANETDRKVPDIYRQWGCRVHPLSCSRSPLSKNNYIAVGQIKSLIEKEQYDIVHCHTPIAAACTRLACIRARKKGTKVFYTAHGFHFYKGAPLKNWLIYFPVEWLCSFWTDLLITINREDFSRAQKLHAKKTVYVPGVGVDVARFSGADADRGAKRAQLGIPEDAFLLLSVGELNENKNQKTVIRAMGELPDQNIHYAIAGQGALKAELEALADNVGIGGRLHMLGYRNDVDQLYKTADALIHPSFREGLPVSMIEAMASGLPCVASCIRGNADLLDEKGGYLFDPHSVARCAESIEKLRRSDLVQMGRYNAERARMYDHQTITEKMKELYFPSDKDEKNV